ncbi:MAG TPA: hypothetical protein QGF58_07595 [Myxococcota bacterium]|nr:hypothetical protein [Myxococcota bacterium]
MLASLILLSCRPEIAPLQTDTDLVRFRPVPVPSSETARTMTERVPGATWDAGLARAVDLLVAHAQDPSARIPPAAQAVALAHAGYPGHAQFGRELNGGAFPDDLVEQVVQLAIQRDVPVDVALSKRGYADGRSLWIAAVAARPVLVDPLPRDVELDGSLPVTVEALSGEPDMMLYLAPPTGPVEQWPLTNLVGRWLVSFHVPGEYRAEVVVNDGTRSDVVLLWSFFVESEPAEMQPLPPLSTTPESPMQAADALYGALAQLREEAGLGDLVRFEDYEPLAREHAAFMAHSGMVGHVIPGLTQGVAHQATMRFVPQATHHENVAAALTWEDAHDLAVLSPGHRKNLLCESCTHVAIGTALEPPLDRVPRLFVTWELLEFPNGSPRELQEYDH